MNCLFKVLPQHLDGVQVRTLTRPLQNLNFVSFSSHSEMYLFLCFGSLSCYITQLPFSFRSQTDDRTFSFRIFW
ncbi:hypothetical protein AAFF_G00176200 [Aldrovandia affinis]|uniref:Uncharacterized protein n=1 Tax=Aldrovandia affinis TaxID=143900 RepID=A0AAD7RNQ4_9TELE|nr:hypothetical protein AAFF_G00176200 [Aldrovandia affinis]